MPKTFRALLVILQLVASAVSAQDAAKTPDGFRLAMPGWDYQFPRDHGAHDEFRTEWWYYTGHLFAASGHRYGFELTFFRVGVNPSQDPPVSAWELRNLSLAHFAITDIDGKKFRYHEKLNRSSRFTAGAAAGMLHVFNEGWSATTQPDGSWRVIAIANGDAIDLTMRTRKVPAIHGENGISVKATGVGFASHYYSMTRLEVAGSVASGGKREMCRGLAWMDHEFGSSVLRESQQGWDWFSIQLDNETELMLYVIRRTDGTPDVTSSGTFVNEDGDVIHIRREQMKIDALGRWKSRRSGAVYPMGWRVSIPSLDVSLTLTPLLQDQELVTTGSTGVTYWEGAVDVDGSSGNVAVKGNGYVEMTGYDRAFRAQ